MTIGDRYCISCLSGHRRGRRRPRSPATCQRTAVLEGTGGRCKQTRRAPGLGPAPPRLRLPFPPPRWADGRRGIAPSPRSGGSRAQGRAPRPGCWTGWERGAPWAARTPSQCLGGLRARRARARPERLRGREGTALPAPRPQIRLGVTGKAEILRSAVGLRSPKGRAGPRRARRRGGTIFVLGGSPSVLFRPSRRAPAPRARGWYFSTRLAGAESAARPRPAASRGPGWAGAAGPDAPPLPWPAGRPAAGRQAERPGGAPRRTKGVQCCSKVPIPPGAQYEEGRSGKIQYFPG